MGTLWPVAQSFMEQHKAWQRSWFGEQLELFPREANQPSRREPAPASSPDHPQAYAPPSPPPTAASRLIDCSEESEGQNQ